ncbi:hypothetical protein AcetOrient_orf00121 [Acetobacter orientalis]|uniref:Uncharacterized protein n=1 Tax=Acetobacter orientalis TaxID=146474 RepID=A0A2Z5ZDC3_9PROT|nr:hypothetical protein AcetOrient_orf00121 [Acetobacter orientalis]
MSQNGAAQMWQQPDFSVSKMFRNTKHNYTNRCARGRIALG